MLIFTPPNSELIIPSINLSLPPFGYLFWFIPSVIMAIIYRLYVFTNMERNPRNQLILRKKYDFIIVGAGSAGSVVANRLSEHPTAKILLLEAGGDENPPYLVPGIAIYAQLSKHDWKYRTEPQDSACLGSVGQRCFWPRGKGMGGSSAINFMLYVRGNRNDYDSWESAGNSGWGYDDVLPYFRKSENNKNKYFRKNKEYHGKGGYLTVEEARWRTPLAQSFIEGGVSLGYLNRDINSRFQTGFMIPQGTVRDGLRLSASRAFLRPIRWRGNLHIAKYSFVTKVIIDPNSRRAIGVKVFRHGIMKTIFAKKEVILCAGAVNTPQLLMLSGIGPRANLLQHSIPVIQDLAVGQNLQDHAATAGLVFLIDSDMSLIQQRYENLCSVLRFIVCHKGPLTVLGGVEGLGFVNTPFANTSIDYPDIELQFVSAATNSDGGRQYRKIQGLTENLWRRYYLPIAFRESFHMQIMLLRPKSRGSVTLRSNNPFHKPILVHNYFTDAGGEDIATLVEGAKIAVQVGKSQAFQKYGATLYTEKLPGCEAFTVETDDYYECVIRQHTNSIYHLSGTAKMGPIWDPDAVVDPQLRVYGVSGLRVVDASIMPTVVSGNTNAAVIMIAEKASDMIRNDWFYNKIIWLGYP